LTTPEINLLAETPPGRTWLEVVLEIEPEDFRLRDVRELRRALTRLLELGDDDVRVVSIARWQPIVALELPAPHAEWTARSFETSPEELRRAIGGLPLRSMRLDAEGARTLSISRSAADRSALTARDLTGLARRWGKVLLTAVLGAVAVLVGGALALIGAAFAAAGRLWRRVAGRSTPTSTPIPPRPEEDGWRESVAVVRAALRWLGRFLVLLARLLALLGRSLLELLHLVAEGAAQAPGRAQVGRLEESDIREKYPDPPRPWKRRVLFEDSNDALFLGVLAALLLLAGGVFWML